MKCAGRTEKQEDLNQAQLTQIFTLPSALQ
jgi:hypothetical protein